MHRVRLASPRRTNTQSNIGDALEVVRDVAARAGELRGDRIVEGPATLGHFSAWYALVEATTR